MNYVERLTAFNADKCIANLRSGWKSNLEYQMRKSNVFVYGTGRLGKFAQAQLKKVGINIYGFLDSKHLGGGGLEIKPITDVRKEDIIIIASMSYPEIEDFLKSRGFEQMLYYEELPYHITGISHYHEAYAGQIEELGNHIADYVDVFERLQDKTSQLVFDDIIQYKQTFDSRYLRHAMKISLEHGICDFDETVTSQMNDDTVFMDIGAFNGESSKHFIEVRNGSYKKIYLVEPDFRLINSAKDMLKDYNDIIYLNVAAGNKDEQVFFNKTGDDDGSVSESGDEKVQMVTLGKYVENSNYYLKFDVEGAENLALEGVSEGIRSFRPMLGVSVYHKVNDLHNLMKQVLSYRNDYRISLRHYCTNICDSMMYFF